MIKNVNEGLLKQSRQLFHKRLLEGPLTITNDVPAVADKDNDKSISIASGMLKRMGATRTVDKKHAGQTAGGLFEKIVKQFVEETFLHLKHLRPGSWNVITNPGAITQFEQYRHLEDLLALVKKHPEVKSSLGGDYLIKPDIVIARSPEPDEVLNGDGRQVVSADFPAHSPLRRLNNGHPILHASISCKWTIRSDRSQNTRTEALNLMRNRKGTVPHAVAVIAEPLPSRIGSIAYGTGDLDCIYHIALPELLAACLASGDDDELQVLIKGRRLRDIADLPLDLAT
ncbi:NgoMIV family type II restriction endonuclease [Geminisphaera colitermitum]|uniref:NgoMIV family type II restriction endonuclease n=1 Tax=Geminisphaera colitermitum TaxID=1148786 RepID=UPI000158C572|nr:NgoMIV family type II restriction endonuclease [Geminisphaera colitermitum]